MKAVKRRPRRMTRNKQATERAEELRSRLMEDIVGTLESLEPQVLYRVAADAGVTVASMYFWMSGVVRNPRIGTLLSVADALGMEVKLTDKWEAAQADSKSTRNARRA